MKNTLREVFHSGKFLVGFVIIVLILLTVIIYPLVNPGNPLEMIGVGTFFKPGTYISVYDSINTNRYYTLKLSDADAKRVASRLSEDDKTVMKEWLIDDGVDPDTIDTTDTTAFVQLWEQNYDSTKRFDNMIAATRNRIKRINDSISGMLNNADIVIATDDGSGKLTKASDVKGTDYVNTSDVASTIFLPLGTDNFGRDVLKELVSACRTSLMIGLIAGAIATFIGLTLGLLSGYLGGVTDDIIMFFTNLFTIIPSFILLILISFSLGQDARGATTVAVVIGLTSWVWTTRSVRAQVTSLRNRDHVNLSKLSGHSLLRILISDILPYIASYVVMALILQICSGILSEAALSMLGLGPKTTVTPTLGLMMFWSMAYTAHLNGAWWAYFPVVFLIALISFSLNLMNTGLDQVFNPQLRD